ncbi:MAG: hypothetical protein HS132_19135 [Planctomycetia bacterium]|nr:hypothetical protein [Planctomycetia bacterium]
MRRVSEEGTMDGPKEWKQRRGHHRGKVISPLLANLYLSKIDHEMARLGHEMVRYADDSVIPCRNEEEAKRALKK